MTMWNGYEQHPDAHPERPWWRRQRSPPGCRIAPLGWVRTDGAWSYRPTWNPDTGNLPTKADEARADAGLAVYDAAHPLPAPPPKCGQVWKMDTDEAVIVGRRPGLDFDGLVCVRWGWATQDDLVPWPPEGAVLVAGPHSPWSGTP
jgi:hypothetical protein